MGLGSAAFRRVRRFPVSPTIGRHDVPPLFKELLRIDALLFERDVYGSHVFRAEASELDYTYHDRWRASDHEEEREEDLEFSRQIDMKARPLFDQEDERIERLLWGEHGKSMQ